MLANAPQLYTLMLVTSSVGLTMLFTGMQKKRLTWRSDKRKRRSK